MPSPERARSLPVLMALLVLSAGCAFGASYVLYRRSTIPLRIDATVVQTRLRHEKHPGRDDAHFMLIEAAGRRRELQIDRAVFEALRPGDMITKAAWQQELLIAARPVALRASADARGMLGVSVATLLALLAALGLTLRASTDRLG